MYVALFAHVLRDKGGAATRHCCRKSCSFATESRKKPTDERCWDEPVINWNFKILRNAGPAPHKAICYIFPWLLINFEKEMATA